MRPKQVLKLLKKREKIMQKKQKKLEFILNHQGSTKYSWLSSKEKIQQHLAVLKEHYGNDKDAVYIVYKQLSN